MHLFGYKRGRFFCESVPVEEIARRVGTPAYVYSYGTILDHYRKVKSAFAPAKALICYAMKANSNAAVLRALAKAGSGFDVVSGGELKKALAAGATPSKIVYASVGKTVAEIEAAIRAGILFFNVESAQELEQIERVCRRWAKRQRVGLRLNPEVDPHTHSFITTGHKASKFGMDLATVRSLLRRRREFPHLVFAAVHIHIGSQILEARPFQAAIEKALALIAQAKKEGAPIEYLNIGGGLGIVYHRESPQTAAEYARRVLPLLKRSGLKVILEPGRFIVGNSGVLLTRVLYLKESHFKKFAIVDAGMNDLIRPSLYGAYHEIVPAAVPGTRNGVPGTGFRSSKKQRYDIVGPVCESGDFLAQDRMMPAIKAGDLLAVMGAGAYGFVMASNYNARPRPAEVMVRGAKWHLVRRRETAQDLARGESVPGFLR
ncbi:MAG: diaminopimelate decarboxylase [Candidatus Omnitrophica bacterium]|nr:diaminopimelate decarboxylase [Candidatus Omnitrophota bacterium]